jgi:hypothetical protein
MVLMACLYPSFSLNQAMVDPEQHRDQDRDGEEPEIGLVCGR